MKSCWIPLESNEDLYRPYSKIKDLEFHSWSKTAQPYERELSIEVTKYKVILVFWPLSAVNLESDQKAIACYMKVLPKIFVQINWISAVSKCFWKHISYRLKMKSHTTFSIVNFIVNDSNGKIY